MSTGYVDTSSSPSGNLRGHQLANCGSSAPVLAEGPLWHQLQPFCQFPANPHLWHHGKLHRTQKQSRESPIQVTVGSACCTGPTQRTVVKATLPEGTAGGWEASCIRDGCLGVVPSPLPAMPPKVFTITWSQLPIDLLPTIKNISKRTSEYTVSYF